MGQEMKEIVFRPGYIHILIFFLPLCICQFCLAMRYNFPFPELIAVMLRVLLQTHMLTSGVVNGYLSDFDFQIQLFIRLLKLMWLAICAF